MKKYAVKEAAPDSNLLGHLLFHRGVKTPEEAELFLNPDYEKQIHDPFLLKDMDKAADRIIQAIRANGGKGEKVLIYSDYDMDGIPGGVVLHDFFKKAGFKNFTNYIPHRHDEGFGLNSDAVKQFIADGVKLLITIDCGIADTAHVKGAQDAGIDVIITDHHLPPAEASEVPPAFAIINPKQAGCAYPEKMLCGSGVVFKLIQGILKKDRLGIKEGQEKWLLDMVGIATLSDMVPLIGENRVLAHYGLTVLRKSPRLGVMWLLRELGVDQRYITEDDIGFTIGPRINAASRMGVPMDAFNLLVTDDPSQADHFAKHLNKINDERKGTVAALVKEAKKTIEERWGKGSEEVAEGKMPGVIVMGNPQWRPALAGLVANRLAEKYERPVFIWGRDGDGVIKGSCRSDGETNLVELMRLSDANFIQSGGHAFSGGFSISNENIHDLPEKLNAGFEKLKKGARAETVILADKEMPLDSVTWDTYRVIERLAPFGVANPKPLFMFKNVVPSSVRQFGKEKNHLEIVFGGDSAAAASKSIKAIGFFKTAEDWKENLGGPVTVGKPLTLLAHFEKSIFRGKTELRLRIVDVIS